MEALLAAPALAAAAGTAGVGPAVVVRADGTVPLPWARALGAGAVAGSCFAAGSVGMRDGVGMEAAAELGRYFGVGSAGQGSELAVAVAEEIEVPIANTVSCRRVLHACACVRMHACVCVGGLSILPVDARIAVITVGVEVLQGCQTDRAALTGALPAGKAVAEQLWCMATACAALDAAATGKLGRVMGHVLVVGNFLNGRVAVEEGEAKDGDGGWHLPLCVAVHCPLRLTTQHGTSSLVLLSRT